VHAFMGAVLLGVRGLGQLRPDTQTDPPGGQPREATDRGGRSEGDAVVGPNGLGQAKLAEEALEGRASSHRLGREESLTAEQVPAVGVGDG